VHTYDLFHETEFCFLLSSSSPF